MHQDIPPPDTQPENDIPEPYGDAERELPSLDHKYDPRDPNIPLERVIRDMATRQLDMVEHVIYLRSSLEQLARQLHANEQVTQYNTREIRAIRDEMSALRKRLNDLERRCRCPDSPEPTSKSMALTLSSSGK